MFYGGMPPGLTPGGMLFGGPTGLGWLLPPPIFMFGLPIGLGLPPIFIFGLPIGLGLPPMLGVPIFGLPIGLGLPPPALGLPVGLWLPTLASAAATVF